jgi:hypothetical protein
MTEIDLRALVRDAVARHLGRPPAPAPPDPRAPLVADLRAGHDAGSPAVDHPSHALYLTVVNAGEACVIEPSVPCDHCGYCRSHGH